MWCWQGAVPGERLQLGEQGRVGVGCWEGIEQDRGEIGCGGGRALCLVRWCNGVSRAGWAEGH